LAVLAGVSLAEQQLETQDSCLALALNGGGSKGAYQAGVIYGWMHHGNPEDF
jgi:predicted acylesterase/phospholipase RssA